jgi:hypothetical protein
MSMGRKQARLSSEELHQVKQLMGALLALLSFWALASLDMGSPFILLLGGMAAAFSFLMPKLVSRIPPVTWRWAGPILLFLIGADFILHIPEFIPPLVRMVVLLIIYRMLAPRNRREDLQVILLCLFCVVMSGVMTVSLLFAFQILMFTPLAMALLFVICLLDRGQDSETHAINWEHFRWGHMIRRVRGVLDFRILLLNGIMFTVVVAISTLLFILTPRFNFDQAIPFLEMSTAARSGFSEDVELGEVSEIQEDNSVALRIDVPSLDAVSAAPYWRMLILDKYEGGRFRLSRSLRTKPLRVFKEERELRSGVIPIRERTGSLWTIYMEGGISRYLPLAGDYSGLRFQNFQDIELVRDVHVLGLDSVGQNVFSYQIEDLQFNRRFSEGEADRNALRQLPVEVESSESLAYPLTCLELNLSSESLEVLAAVNTEIINGSIRSVADYSEAATNYLWERFAYSLKPNGDRSRAEDPIIGWLTDGSQGHCELFAGAFILLAREAGYPARMVVGFAGGSWNAVEDYFVVRNRDAHAWVEIYDAEQGNWLRVDPTPGRGSSDPEVVLQASMEFESGWAAWVDSLRIQWYRRVVNFEQEDQVELAMTLKDVFLEYSESFKERLRGVMTAFEELVESPLQASNLRPVAAFVLLLGVVYYLWRSRYSLLNLIFKLLRKPKALDPVRRQAGRYLVKLKVKQVDAELVDELQALRFGPEVKLSDAKPVFARARSLLRSRR